jgi:hypothetical protein
LRTIGVADAQGLGPSKNMGLNYDGTYAGARLSALFVYDGLDDHQHEERLETRLHL